MLQPITGMALKKTPDSLQNILSSFLSFQILFKTYFFINNLLPYNILFICLLIITFNNCLLIGFYNCFTFMRQGLS